MAATSCLSPTERLIASTLYVEPIYIQATSGGIPQLKKIVLATGNTLIYTDTYDQALAQLSGAGRAAARQRIAPP